ncbi:MAG: pilus assembly protein [Rhodoglobus sp.]|nr:pilus assembly protein [Rhodoglobus sp.]
MPTFFAALSANYRLEWTVDQISQNIGANQSTVSYSEQIRQLSGSGYASGDPGDWAINIDGQPNNGSIAGYDFTVIDVLPLTSGTTVINHNADGTKTISVSASFSESPGGIGSGTASGSFALTTIPRASTATFEISSVPQSSVDAGTALTLDMNRASSGFTHTLSYDFGPASNPTALTNQTSGLGASSGVGASTTFTPPLALLNSIPNNLSGVLTLRTTTYSGATLIGTTTSTLAITVPTGSSYEPDFGTITNSEGTAGVAAAIGAYVQSISKLALAITSATAPYGATVVSSTVTVGGVLVLSGAGAVSGTMPAPIVGSGTVAVVGTVTDSRNRTHSETVNVTVLPYSQPVIIAAQVRRALSGGTVDDDGTYIRADINAAVQSLTVAAVQKNQITTKISTRLRGTSTWTLKTTIGPTGTVITYNSHAEVGTYPVNQAHEVLIEVLDKLGVAAAPLVLTVGTSGIPFHLGGPTEGAGFGMYSQHGPGTVDAFDQMYQNNGEPVQSAVAATTSAMGPVELATVAESAAMADITRAATPGGLAFLGLAARVRNKVRNGAFAINQRGYASGGSLASGAFGHDGWKANAATTSYTFTAAPQGQLVTLASGKGLQEIIERADVPAGSYVLSWSGTATGRVYNVGASVPAYAASPVLVTLDGTADVTVEFTAVGATKTLGLVQLEAGSIATRFEETPIALELLRCQRYYARFEPDVTDSILGLGAQQNTVLAWCLVDLPVPLRAKPTVGFSGLVWSDFLGFNAAISAFATTFAALGGTSKVSLTATFAANGAANRPGGIKTANSTTSYLDFSADL